MNQPSRSRFVTIALCLLLQTTWAGCSHAGERTVTGIVDGQKFGTNVIGEGASVTFEGDSNNEARLLKACDVGSRCKVVVVTKGADVVVRLISAQRVGSALLDAPKPAVKLPADTASAALQGPSFSCAKAASTVERIICADTTLALLDRDLSLAYKRTLDAPGTERPQAQKLQRDWVQAKRNACTDAACLATAYRDRIQALTR